MVKKKEQQDKRQRVFFSFKRSNAQRVSLVGDFNDWDPKRHPMKSDGDGTWTKTVMLFPGTYEYKFWSDGNWIADLEKPDLCKNSYGTMNNRISVAPKKTA